MMNEPCTDRPLDRPPRVVDHTLPFAPTYILESGAADLGVVKMVWEFNGKDGPCHIELLSAGDDTWIYEFSGDDLEALDTSL